jgi:hypothetical protein
MRLVWLCCVVGLAGCSFGAPKSPAELSREDACRALADRAYNLQHPDYLSRGDDQSTTPFSGSGTISLPSEGLSDEYAHRVAVDDCVRRQTSSTQGGASVGPSGSH